MQIHTVEMTDEDEFLILACDGIWEDMSSQKVHPPSSSRTHTCMATCTCMDTQQLALLPLSIRPTCQHLPNTKRQAIGRFCG